MEKFGGTMADLWNPVLDSNVPWLAFEEHPESGVFETGPKAGQSKMYEDALWEAYDKSIAHFTETKGAASAIRSFMNSTPEGDWTSFESFNADGYNEIGCDEKEFLNYVKYFRSHPEKLGVGKGGASANFNDDGEVVAPEPTVMFDPNAEGADPVLLRLWKKKAAQQGQAKMNSVAESVEEKYYAIYDAARRLANGRSLKHHVFICGDAGVGKSYMVEKAVTKGQSEWKPNKRDSKKPEFVNLHGSIGTSFTPLLLFFFKNRQGKLILLDDADGFILNKDQEIQNFLKAMLDPDMHAVTVPATIRARANQALKKEWDELQARLGESSSYIQMNMNRLHEGVASCTINGQEITWNVTMDEAKELYKEFGCGNALTRCQESILKSRSSKYDRFGNLKLYTEAYEDDEEFEDDEFDDDETDIMSDREKEAIKKMLGVSDDDDMLNQECPQIDSAWYFTSSLMLISNLKLSQVNSAVRSRCQCVELKLTVPEFICRAESIIDHIKVGEDSSVGELAIEWAKKEAFEILKSAVINRNVQIDEDTPPIQINIPLEFRLIGTLAGQWLARYDRWCERNNIENSDDPKTFAEAEEAIFDKFYDWDLRKTLYGDS